MEEEDIVLNEQDRKKLDGIVSKMTANKETPDKIKFVVEDFKTKYGKKSQPIAEQGDGDFSKKLDFSIGNKKKTLEQQVFEAQRGVSKIKSKIASNLQTVGEDPRDKIVRYGNEKVIADTSNNAVDSDIRNKVDLTVKHFNEEFRPTVAKIRDYVALNEDYSPESIKKQLGLGNDYDEHITKAITDRKKDMDFYNNQTPYLQYSKKDVVDDGKGNKIVVDSDNFVNTYFGKDKLKAIGIDPEDFNGYLELNDKKKGFEELSKGGFFTEGGSSDFLGSSGGHDAKLAYDLQRLNLINGYFDDNTKRDKSLAYEYLRQANGGSKEAKEKYRQTIERLQAKTEGYKKFITENLPSYVAHEQVKNDKLKEEYKKYKQGNADEFLNWGRGMWEGTVQAIHGLTATVYDKLGAEDTATQIRLQKEQEARYDAAPDLYYITESGKKVNYKGTNYLVTDEGEVIDTDDKLKATSLLEPEDYNAITKEAEKVNERETSNSVGGAVQQSSGVIGDMAIQLLLTRGVGKATTMVRGTVGTVRSSEAVFAMENAIGRTSIGKSLYSRAAAGAIDAEVLNTTSLATKLTRIPAVYGDVLITQGAYGYSTGYENTYSAMRQAGHSDEESKALASEAGTQMAALYGATAFIAPQTHILKSLEGNTVRNLIQKGIAQIEKEGVDGFRRTIGEGAKDLLKNITNVQKAKNFVKEVANKETRGVALKEAGRDILSSNIVQGGLKAVEEGGKEVVQENIQQYGENEIVNANINDLAGEHLLKDTYTLEDFKNTTALAFSAALMMNSPSMVRGMDKMSILSKLSNNQENFKSSLEHYVKSGLTTQENADALKRDVETFHKYRNMIPPKTNNNVAFEVMNKLRSIDDITVQMDNVHPALKEVFKEQIDKQKTQLKQLLDGTKTEINDSEGKYTPNKEGQSNNRETQKTEEKSQINDSGIVTNRDNNWDNNTKETLPDSKYESEEDFKEVVKNGKWGMLTAENPDATQVSDDSNFNNNEKAIEWLKEKGYNPQPIFGKYGNSENSFFVEDLSKEDAVEFAKEFKQESVATNEGLVYQDGTMNPRIKGSESFEAKSDFYSAIKVGDKHVNYSIDYDFDNKIENNSNEGVDEGVSEGLNNDEIPVEKYKEIADKFRNAKFYKTPADSMRQLNTDLTAPLKLAWDTTMEVIATSVEQSGNLAKAINQGVKHLKTTEWYKSLTKEGKQQAIDTLTNEANTNLTALAEAVVPKSKKSVKSTIKEKTGQTDTSREVVTTESKLLKLKLKTAEQAQRIQRSFDNKNRSNALANLRQLVETLSKNGTVSPAILKSMLKGAVNLNTSDAAAVSKFMERVNKVIDKINDRAKIVEVKKLKRNANRLSKTAPANVRELGKAAVGINENYLSPDELQTYADVLTEIKNSNAPVQGNNQSMVDVEAAYKTLQALSDSAETNRLEEIKDSLGLMGIDPVDLNMTDSELRNFWDTELNVDGTTLEDKKQAALEKAEELRDKLKSIAEVYKSSLSGFNYDSIKSEKSKEVAKKLGQANLEFMDSVTLKEYVKSVQNLITNGNLAGAGKVSAQIQSINGMIKFVTKVINSGVPLGMIKIDTKVSKGNFLNDLKSMALLMKEVYKTPELMGDFNYYSGLNDLGKGQVRASREINNTTKELDLLFKELSSKNKNLRNSDNTILRGIVANLIQGDTKEELDINKSRIEDHIKKADKHADEIQSIYDNFKGFKTQQDILDHLKSMDDGNYELVSFWMDKFKGIKEQLKENTEVVHNEIFNEVSENYLPIKIKVDGSLDLEQKGSTFNIGGITSPKQSSTTIKRNKSKKLPNNGLLDLDFDAAMINRYRMGLNDIHTSNSLQQVKSFFGSKQITSLMGKNNTQVFVKRINYMQKLATGVLNETSDAERTVSKVERAFKRIGVTAALGGVTAIIKQTVPVMTAVAAQVGAKNFGSFVTNFRVAQTNSLIQDYSTSQRGESTLGTKSIVDSANDLNRYKGFSGGLSNISRKSGQFFDKTRNALMKPLQLGDEAVAKAAWTTYYLEYLKKNGYDVGKIDISKEHEEIGNDEVRQKAASYAEVRVEETQVASDNQRSASLFSNPHVGVAALRSIFLPFQQFNINSKMRMIADIKEITNVRQNGKFAKQVSNMTSSQLIESVMNGNMLNNAHTTFEGRNLGLKKSIRSLGANITEQVMFQGIKAFALTLFTSHSAALFKFLIDDDDNDSDENHQEWLDKGIDWKFKTKQFYSNLSKDVNPLLIGNFMEEGQIQALNYMAYAFGNDSEEFETYTQWADSYKKENGSLPWYSYNGNKSAYGIYSIPVDIGSQILENGDLAYDGKAFITNDWGKEEKYIMDNKSQLRFMRAMFIMECLRATTGVEADSYRELEKVRKELLKISKVKE